MFFDMCQMLSFMSCNAVWAQVHTETMGIETVMVESDDIMYCIYASDKYADIGHAEITLNKIPGGKVLSLVWLDLPIIQ